MYTTLHEQPRTIRLQTFLKTNCGQSGALPATQTAVVKVQSCWLGSTTVSDSIAACGQARSVALHIGVSLLGRCTLAASPAWVLVTQLS